MGWCQEFGLQISGGCRHLMIAGPDSCSCPDCGAICHGRFTGCSIVWSESTTPILVGGPPLALGSGPVAAPPVATNGKAPMAPSDPASATSRPVAAPVGGPDGPSDRGLGDAALVNTVSQNGAAGAGTAVADGDLRQLCADLKLEMRRLNRTVERLASRVERDVPSERSERDAVLRDVDARFAWLTKELSDRLVTLGNEIVAIKRHLQVEPE